MKKYLLGAVVLCGALGGLEVQTTGLLEERQARQSPRFMSDKAIKEEICTKISGVLTSENDQQDFFTQLQEQMEPRQALGLLRKKFGPREFVEYIYRLIE